MHPLWKTAYWFLKRINRITIRLSNSTPRKEGIYSKELKPGTQRNTWTWMLTVTLFTITKRWKQPKCPSTDEWINTMWYIHSMGSYSAIKRNKVLIHATIWINLKNIMLNKRSQTQITYRVIPFIRNIQNRLMETEHRFVVTRAGMKLKWTVTA